MDASAAEASVLTGHAKLQHSSTSTSTTHQIRSRITVVCAECKRLKLKCDRKQPCGSCTKRDTISKCQYTAAAAEKVDIHSLHNRTTHLEAFMTMSTNGRFQAAYPSTNPPPAFAATLNTSTINAAASPPFHEHHHHAAAPLTDASNDSISRSFHTLASNLSEDLEFAISTTLPRGQTLGNNARSDPSWIDNGGKYDASGDDPVPPQSAWNSPLPSTRTRTTQSPCKETRVLPSMGVYFPSNPGTPNSFVQHSSPSLCSTPTQEPNSPRVSTELLACLPSFPTCQRLLQIAGDVLRVRPLQFDPTYGPGNGWEGFEKKCLLLLGGAGKERNEKHMTAKRAREIYMAGQSQHHLNRVDLDGVGSPGRAHSPEGDRAFPSLTFFAMVCATLAIGAAARPNNDDEPTTSDSPAFFYSLAQQALGVWDTCRSTSTSLATNDCEEMEYIFACLLCIVYLLRSGAATTIIATLRDGKDYETFGEPARKLSSLIGKMVNIARAMHLDKESTWTKQRKTMNVVAEVERRDQDSANAATGSAEFTQEKVTSSEEWKRMIWWEIVFYDLFISDALGQLPYISVNPHITMLPVCAASVETSDGDHHPPSEIFTQNLDGPAPQSPVSVGSISAESDEMYLGARYRLTQVAQTIKKRSYQPDCCCGYTLDQAALLENEVRTWLETLPPNLRVQEPNGYTDTTELPWHNLTHSDVVKRLQAFELAITANVLVVSIYSPFLRVRSTSYGRRSSLNIPAASSCTYAAHTAVRLAVSLQSLLTSTQAFCVLPVMFDFFPLDGLMSDAAVICAHAAFTRKLSSLPFSPGALLEDVAVGLKVLSNFTSPTTIMTPTAMEDTQKKALEALQRRLDRRKRGSMKRKHCMGDASVGASSKPAIFIDETILPDSRIQRDIADADQDSAMSSPTRPDGRYSADSTMLGTCSDSSGQSAIRERNKKGTKKSGYPVVGIRIREGRSFIHDSRMPPPKVTASQPRSLSHSEAVLKFKQKLQQQTDRSQSGSPPTSSSPNFDTTQAIPGDVQAEAIYRSPSTTTRVSETLHTPFNVGTSLPNMQNPVELPPRKRQNVHDIRESPAMRQQLLPPTPSPSSTLAQQVSDQGRQHHPVYGSSLSANQSLDSLVYGVPSTSPFSTTSSFPSSTSPHTTPPLFGTAVGLVSTEHSTSYFSPPRAYGATYCDSSASSGITHVRTPVTALSGIDQTIMPDPNTQVYGPGSQQQQGMEEFNHQLFQRHTQNQASDATSFNSNILSERDHTMITSWPTHSQTYWEEGGYRFYSS